MADPLKMWLQTPFGKAIQEHIKNGYRVFPLYGINDDLTCGCGENPCGKNNKGAGKHPYRPTAPNGVLNATGDIEAAAEMFEYREDLNVGIATGKPSKIIVIDIDNKNDNAGDESLAKIQQVLGFLPPTMCLTTGNGYHLVFDYPEGGLKSGTKSYGDGYPDIDTRGDGGYIVIYPSRHFTGNYYLPDRECGEIADIPQAHLDFLRLDRSKKKSGKEIDDRFQRSGNESEWTEDQIAEALTFIDADVDYLQWIFIGMGLHKEGFSLDMWDKWSATGKKYAGIADLQTHWRSFNSGGMRTIGTIIDWARTHGWKPRHEERVPEHEAQAMVLPMINKIKEKKKKEKEAAEVEQEEVRPTKPVPIRVRPEKKESATSFRPKFAFDPMELPGGLGDTIRYITKYAIYEQPELTMMNVIAFAGAVFGRRYASPLNTRTNLYTVGVADTGAGKEFSVTMMERIAMESGLLHHMGANSVRSDIGILKSLVTNASQLFMVDEFGMLMCALSDPGASYHHKAIISLFTKIYSKSGGMYKHGDVGDERATKLVIASPNLCLYGTTTEQKYIESLRKSAIDSGELNRFIAIPSGVNPMPKRGLPPVENDEALLEWWKSFSPKRGDSLGTICNSGTVVPAPKRVEWGECDERQFEIQMEQTAIRDSTSPTRNLWIRMHENIIKIAMIFAIARDQESPVMIMQDIDIAYSIVKNSVEYMEHLALNSMADNDQEQSHHEVYKAIVQSGKDGMARKDILRAFRKLRKRDIDDLLSTMIEEETVVVGRVAPKTGRPAVVYFAA